jgi:outer membrane protein assembly factor BamB
MRRRIAIGVIGLVLLGIAGAAFAYFRLNDKPSGELDTELAGVSVETATDVLPIETETAPDTTTPQRPPEPAEQCWPNFGGDPQRQLSRPVVNLGLPRRTLWTRRVGLMEYPPTFCDGRVYVNLQFGVTLALNAKTGRVLWRREADAPTASSPAIYGTLLIVSSHAGTVTALRREDGRKVWRLHVPGIVESSPVVVDDVTYFGTTEGRVFAVNARTGRVRWAYNTGGRINSSPSIFGTRLCVSTYAGSVFCLNKNNGNKIWSTYVKRDLLQYESFYASASTDGPRVFTTARTGKVVAFSGRTGRVLWTYNMGALAYSTPAIANGRVYVGAFDGRVRALRATDGKLLWTSTVGGRMLAPALVVGKLVFVSTLDGATFGLRASDGKVVWRRSKGRYAPGIATDRHYFFSLRAHLMAVRGENSPREVR